MALGGCSWVVLQRPEWLQVRCCLYYPRTTVASSCCLALAHLQSSAPPGHRKQAKSGSLARTDASSETEYQAETILLVSYS